MDMQGQYQYKRRAGGESRNSSMDIGNQTGNAITTLQRSNRIYARLLEISLILNSNLAIRPILNAIMEAACEITNAEAASILLYNPNSDELRFVASTTPGTNIEDLMKIPVPMQGSIAGQIALENKPIIINHAEDDARIFRNVDNSIGFVTRSLLGVPMHVKGTVIGVLEALNKRENVWTDENLAHLTILASHAAVAVQNANQTEALRKANNELEKIDKIKNDFIAIASHELRTPLAVILGYASFLKEEADGEMGEHASAVLNSAMNMRMLIEDMTNLRFLQQGRLELDFEDMPVSNLIQSVVNDLSPLAKIKGQTLHVSPENGDLHIRADLIKAGMALTNILNNAIKFTANRGLILVETEARPREVWIKVTDNGIGIPVEHLEKIFDEFHQVADHMTRQQNGMGLGLSIARGMIEAHGGRVWAESKGPHKGSTFFIALPNK